MPDVTSNLPPGVARQYPASAEWQAEIARRKEAESLGLNDRGIALDYFSNPAARTGWGTPSLTESTDYILERLSYDYQLLYTLYRNHWIAQRIVNVPAADMVKAWPRLTSETDPKHLSRIDKTIRATKTKEQVEWTLALARLFGGAGALIIIDGQENQFDEPLDLDAIEIGAYRGLLPFDRWSGIQPDSEISTDFRKPLEFNLPKHYRVQAPNGSESFRVHASRILRFNGPMVPAPEFQAQMYWGISVLEPVYEELRKRDNLSWNILSLTYRANLIGLQIPDLAQMLSGLGSTQTALQQFYGRMQALNHLMSNQNLVMLPKDGDLKSVQYGMTGLAEVLQQFQLDIAGAAQMPVTKIFGRTLTGLGQSNDADLELYADFIATLQSSQMRPQLDSLYRVICMSTLGEIPDDLDLQFPSVRTLSEKEKAELAKATSESVFAGFGAGVISKPQALKELKQSSDLTGIFTNITDEDIAEAEEEEKVAQDLGIMPGEQEGESSDKATEAQKIERKGSEIRDALLTEITFAGLPVTGRYIERIMDASRERLKKST